MALVINVITSPAGGGAEVLVRGLGQGLRRSGIHSEVVYFNRHLAGCENLQLHENETVLGLGARNPIAILRLRQAFRRRLKEYGAVFVHAHLTWPFFFVALASIGLPVTLFYTEHSTSNRRRKIWLMRYLERIFYSRYGRIICISKGAEMSLKPWIGRRLAARAVVVPNGGRVYDLRPRGKWKGGAINFVSVGSLTRKKGFRTSIIALSSLSEFDWHYTIVGEGEERSGLEVLIRDLGLDGRISLVGWSDRVDRFLHAADVQLIPSLWEGFGLVAVEGMSTGLPVVASNVDGLREVLSPDNDAVCLVDDFTDPGAWRTEIVKCIRKMSVGGHEMSLAAREQAEQFSMERMVKAYSAIYAESFGAVR